MTLVIKPKKRVIFYWFFDKGFFFIITALLFLATYLNYFTQYQTLTLLVLQLIIVTTIFSTLILMYEWFFTEYFLLKKHILIKELGITHVVKYSDIKNVNYHGNLLQHLMGTTNVYVETKNNKKYFIKGVRNFKKIEKTLLNKMTIL